MTDDYRLVYFAKRRGKYGKRNLVKIGITKDLDQRMRALKLDLLFALVCEWQQAANLEAALHYELQLFRVSSYGSTEWFEVGPRLERLIDHVRRTRRWPWDHTQEIIL